MTPIIATALALRANLDKNHPYSFVKSISNVAIDTVDGIKYPPYMGLGLTQILKLVS